jgi:hypothetical protein
MKILYFIKKSNWTTKMSCARRHQIKAIGRHPEVELVISGNGWDNFAGARVVEKQVKPDIVHAYKPLDISGYDNIKSPRVIAYNEMWDKEWTLKEIHGSKSDIVICHHGQEAAIYRKFLPGKTVVHIPHCAEKTVFKDYGLKKDIDVLYTGISSKKFYPLRRKFKKHVQPILLKRGYGFQIFKHPGYRLKNLKAIDRHLVQYAKALNRAKIVVTCSSKYKYALAKYAEIPLCRTALCADVPKENQEWYRKWMIVVGQETPPDRIADKLIGYLKRPKDLEKKTKFGYEENLKCRTMEYYADRFVKVVKECI